ncbi:Lrp/AsnC family transcriptional regulator [Comamonas faecalis]|uniref:siroheme decarboxylase n=1 Tax=Comamonas faecalis TaxID=1387849 RepID=A0ABP7RJZ6_9BURK
MAAQVRAHAPDLDLLNRWQRGFPLVERPFAALGDALDLPCPAVRDRLAALQRAGAVSRVGAVFAPGAGGASTLAAMAVPPERLDAVAAVVSSHPGVNHNYQREHQVNLWFVATGADRSQVERLLQHIERDTGLAVLRLPMLRPYRIDTAFNLRDEGSEHARPTRAAPSQLSPGDWPLAALAEQGLPLVERPYGAWAEQLGCGAGEVLQRLQQWLDGGLLARFGVVVRHHELGFSANAMTVFDVPDDAADRYGDALAHLSGVTLAYRRARAPGWHYNLYCMIHGRDRDAVARRVRETVAAAGLQHTPHAVLFSLRRFKQTGARRFAAHAPVTSESCDAHP